MKTTVLALCLALTLSACGDTGPRTAEPATPTTGGAAPVAPTDTPAPASATPIPPVDTPTAAPTEAPSATPTATPTLVVRSRPTPTSSGPLDFQVYYASCRNAPTAEKPANLLITISVEATGGNGVYRYFHRDVEEPDKFIDVNWERGTRLIGRVTVTSGDGQTRDKEYDFATTDLVCTP